MALIVKPWIKRLIMKLNLIVKYALFVLRWLYKPFKIIVKLLKFKKMEKEKVSESLSLDCKDERMIDATVNTKASKVYAAKKLAQWFSVDFVVKIFGVTILEWHYPPVKNE